MTIAIAWTRSIKDCEELTFVSDSRLSGDGLTFDSCPKVMTLARTDCAIAFAGYTGHAYPMMQQLSLAISSHAPLVRGSMDIYSVRKHALKVFDGMANEIRSSKLLSSPSDTSPGAEFLFGGYSWIKKQFAFWRLHHAAGRRQFVAEPAQWVVHSEQRNEVVIRLTKNPRAGRRLGLIAFAGDQAQLARRLLLEKLNLAPATAELDWTPFEVVRDMLRDPNHSETIGGAPQVVKVYQYMDSAPLGVWWPNAAEGHVHLQGRRTLGYERTERFVLDPDTLRSAAHQVRGPEATGSA
jgi:hypothetical protein